MSALIERLRVALGADYDLLDEMAGGGMGIVFRARDRALDRLVAIKVIRPDLATAAAAERFLREARILASLSHPNIVPVHRAGEADGLGYYVMDCLDGETLAARLARGAPAPAEGRRLADDLLAALEAVHAHGIVHRDVKPSNIFLAGGRAVLGDFGISKATVAETSGVTATGAVVGTPGYMPPEQLAGGSVTARTDVCAAAMVLFEIFTGRQWSFDSHTDRASWNGVPADLAPALRRALEWSPARRWADAGAFRRALTSAPARQWRWRAAAGGSLVVAAALVGWLILRPGRGDLLRVDIQPLTAEGGTTAASADSVGALLLDALRAPADIEFRLAAPGRGPAGLGVTGTAATLGDSLHLSLRVTSQRPGGPAFDVSATGPRGFAVDSAARALLMGIWQSRDPSFRDLPVRAMPRSVPGLTAWARAEAEYARGNWAAAQAAYESTLVIDSTCVLCDLRMITISRWLRVDIDTARARRVADAADIVPPRYRDLIRAGRDTVDRWTALQHMVDASPRFDLAQFIYGDELFHRGGLAGRRRGEAIEHFQQVIALRPGFAPAYGHLAWVAIPEGDSLTAAGALRTYTAVASSVDIETKIVQALVTIGYTWRFGSPAVAAAMTDQALGDPAIAGFADLPQGGLYMSMFDAPAGVVWLGSRFERWPARPDLRTPGIVAQIAGYLALGRADSAAAVIARLRGESSEAEYALCAAEFEAALVLFDSLDARAAWPHLDSLLHRLTGAGAGTAAQRGRAAWMLALLARRAGDEAGAHRWSALARGDSAPRALAVLLDADSLARTDRASALQRTGPLLALDSAGRAGDPFFRALLHLVRAQWLADTGDPVGGARSLLWEQNSDFVSHAAGVVQAGHVDAAFGPIGRWYRAGLLEKARMPGREACDAFQGVARLWREGNPRFAARAAQARASLARLRCGASA